MTGPSIIFSAPSGAGKTTIVHHLLSKFPRELAFSISACNRPARTVEQGGKDYYFLTTEEFKAQIAQNEFLEWEEVYPGRFYGTLRREVERIWLSGQCAIFDVDVQGGLKLKQIFGDDALAVFVQPPSVDALEKRLRLRQTEDEASLQRRVEKARLELTFAQKFDAVLINDQLESALKKAEELVTEFLRKR